MPEQEISLDTPEGRLIEAVMDAAGEAERLRQSADTEATALRPAFADLYRYARGGDAPEVAARLPSDPALQADFKKLVENLALYSFPRAAAASSGDMEQRRVPGAKLFLRRSKADDAQVYLIIELDDPKAGPGLMVSVAEGGAVARADLPPFRDGRAQLLLDNEDALVQAFRDVNSEIYLT